MNSLKRFRPSDYGLLLALAALAVAIGAENVTAAANGDLAHPLDTQTAWMYPVFVAAVVPVLWRRDLPVRAIWASCAVIAASVPMFGWVTRCGFALPLTAVLAYALARFGGGRGEQARGWVGLAGLQIATLVQDSSTGGFGALALFVPVLAVVYGLGRLVRSRSARRGSGRTVGRQHVHA